MIRYDITLDELLAQIDALKPNWRTTAAANTAESRVAELGWTGNGGGSWSDIKPIYMALQHNKCGYCERKLSAEKHEWDVEHYRPKSQVTDTDGLGDLPTGGDSADGYWWLALDPANYLVSCKPCNSKYKSDRFPIARERGQDDDSHAQLQDSEKPYLLFPIGLSDDPPEDVITYVGPTPVPAARRRSHKKDRATVTITFLKLNTREDLIEERQNAIAGIWPSLSQLTEENENAGTFEDNLATVVALTDPERAHSRCLNAFVDLFFSNSDSAAELAKEALSAISSPEAAERIDDLRNLVLRR